jgi:hypothetical protein
VSFRPAFSAEQKQPSMPAVINLVMVVTFLGVWTMIATDLVGRHGREAKRLAISRQVDRNL